MSTTLTAESIKKTIAYYYLLSFCPPEDIKEFHQNMSVWRKQLAETAGMSEAEYFKAAIPAVCRHIVAFHEDTRSPGQHWIDALIKTARAADTNPESAYAFQEVMSKIARLPQRALPENRPHRKKGCAFCRLPCHYGYFTLVSDPDFDELQAMLEAEVNMSTDTQSAINAVWNFTVSHLAQSIEFAESFSIHQGHLGNLSYCLLVRSMASSRLALPEKQLEIYQTINQQLIQIK